MEYQIILTTVIALIAVLTGLGFIFRILLEPVYNRLSNLETGQANLDAGQANLNKRMDTLESKLDKLLNQRKTS